MFRSITSRATRTLGKAVADYRVDGSFGQILGYSKCLAGSAEKRSVMAGIFRTAQIADIWG